jgi:hypothetical protein
MGKPTFDNGILTFVFARMRALDFRYQKKE